jgi:hypothetical protein
LAVAEKPLPAAIAGGLFQGQALTGNGRPSSGHNPVRTVAARTPADPLRRGIGEFLSHHEQIFVSGLERGNDGGIELRTGLAGNSLRQTNKVRRDLGLSGCTACGLAWSAMCL